MARRGRNSMRRGRRGRNNGTTHYPDQAGRALTRQIADCHRFVRRDVRALDLGIAGAGAGFAFFFKLDNLPNFTDFTNLFDSYSIDRVDINVLTGSAFVQIYGAPDYDDAVAPTSSFEMLERQNVKCMAVNIASPNQFRATIVPRMPIEGTAAGPQMAPVGTRIDCADPGVQYFGYKMWFDAPSGAVTLNPRVIFTYHLRFWAAK